MGRPTVENYHCSNCGVKITPENRAAIRKKTGKPLTYCKECNSSLVLIRKYKRKGIKYTQDRIKWHFEQVKILKEALNQLLNRDS